MSSKKLTLSADGTTATVADATFSDIFATALSTDSVITGSYGFLQKGLLAIGGAVVQSYRKLGTFNPL